MSGIMALKKGGKGGKKSAKFKKQAKKRYDERRANVQEQARSNQGSNNNNDKKTTTVLSPLEALIANKDKLVQQDAGDGVRNQYQVEMDNYKKGLGAYAGMDSKKNKEVFKERFPNPLVKVAQGIGNYIKQGGALGILANSLGGGKKAATGFGKDASNMAKDLAGMFGLDGLMGKLVNIAGGRDTNDFNKVIEDNQTSTRMRNNLAYGDPLGLNNAPIYRDPIMDMALPNIDTSMEDQYRQFGSIDDKRRSVEQIYGDNMDVDSFSNSNIDRIYNSKDFQGKLNAVGDDKEAIENSLQPGQFNFNTGNDINLSGDPDEIFEDVSETEYVNPNDVINQGNITTGFSNTPLIDPSGVYTDGTPMYPDAGELDQDSLDILNSNSTEIPDYIRFGRANGGYMNGFPNQNPAESLTASDNIDDRIMKNLQFEKMAPGMMGYNQGGKVMSTFEKLKAIADNNYG